MRSAENPADCTSRGLFPSALLEHPLWWSGPPWLIQDKSEWLTMEIEMDHLPSEEMRVTLSITTHDVSDMIQVKDYSSYTKLLRIVAWIKRFVDRCQHKGEEYKPYLTQPEIMNSEHFLFKASQATHFEIELQALQKRITLPKHSPLLPPFPFSHDEGLIRVGGR